MGTFISGNTALPTPRTDLDPPTGVTYELPASQINGAWDASDDIRTHVNAWVNPKSTAYGAVMDGSTDDSAALGLAVADASSKGYGILVTGRMLVGSGTNTVNVPMRFEGVGALDVRTGATVTLTGGLQVGTPRRIFYNNGGSLALNCPLDYVCPTWWGAVGDGVTDDSAAFASAIAAATASTPPKRIYIPGGYTYLINSTLTVTAAQGLHIYGDGKRATTLKAGASMAGIPIFKFVRSRECSITRMRLTCDGSHIPSAGIEFRQESPSGGIISTANLVDHVYFDLLARGVQMTAATDSNNDLHTINECVFSNLTTAGISIEHANSLVHRFINCQITDTPIGVKVTGGSFTASKCWFNTTDVVLDVSGGFSIYHPIYLSGCGQETGNTGATEGKLIRTDTGANYQVVITGFEQQGGPANVSYIDFRSDGGKFRLKDSRIEIGQAGVKGYFSSATSDVEISGCPRLGITTLEWNGAMRLHGNFWVPGTVTETPGASSSLFQWGDNGAQYTINNLRTSKVQTVIKGGLPAANTGVDVRIGSTNPRSAGYIADFSNEATQLITIDYLGALRMLAAGGDIYVPQLRDAGVSGSVRLVLSPSSYTQLLGGVSASTDNAIILDNGVQQNADKVVVSIRSGGTEYANFSVGGFSLAQGVRLNMVGGGAAATSGTATLSSGSVTVSTTKVTASSEFVLVHRGTSTANMGHLYPSNISAGTSFKINSSNASDADTVFWFMVN